MPSVKRAAERVGKHSSMAYKAFTTIGYAIPKSSTRREAETLFGVLGRKLPVEDAIPIVGVESKVLADYADFHEPSEWVVCSKWSEWWTRTTHLSKESHSQQL